MNSLNISLGLLGLLLAGRGGDGSLLLGGLYGVELGSLVDSLALEVAGLLL